ncbi:MAG: hypothetical protein WCO96_00680 [Actinomycetes bacterium]
MTASGYFNGPWPAEDGGARRLQAPHGEQGLGIEAGESLSVLAARRVGGIQMIVRGPGDSMYALRSILGRRALLDPAETVIERIDPITLESLAESPSLPAGPWWAGGLAVLADGGVVAISGRWAHRLDPDSLQPTAARELPVDAPYNSFVALADGTLVTKDFDRSLNRPATLLALDPVTLEDRASPLRLPETVIARLSADSTEIYAVGVNRAMRIRWDGADLSLDDWQHHYRTGSGGGYGWDPVIAAGRLWFLDQGRHRFRLSMRGSGLDKGPVRLHSIPLDDASGATSVVICGEPYGAITNPPLIDPERMIAVGYDTANGRMTAFDIPETPSAEPTPRWRKAIDSGPHLLRWAETGEMLACDHRAPWPLGTRSGSRLLDTALSDALRLSGERTPHLEPKLAERLAGEDAVVLDIETGEEKGRARLPVLSQSVMFPTAGANRDAILTTMTAIFRVGPGSPKPIQT